jgi:hypothetical protein
MSESAQKSPVSERSLVRRVDLSDVQNPMLRKALEMWSRLKGGRRFPSREEITPRNTADFLRNTVLVRVIEGGKEFQLRIVGDAIVVAQGQSLQGLTTAEIEQRIPGYGALLNRTYRAIHSGRAPIVLRGWFENTPVGRDFFQETLLLPLGVDGEAVDHILVVAAFAFRPADKSV